MIITFYIFKDLKGGFFDMDEMMQVDFEFYEVTSLVKRGKRFYYNDSKYVQDVRLDVYDDDGVYDEVEMLFSNERTIRKLVGAIVQFTVDIEDLNINYEGSDTYVITTRFDIPVALLKAI
jgi:hypothetical protein